MSEGLTRVQVYDVEYFSTTLSKWCRENRYVYRTDANAREGELKECGLKVRIKNVVVSFKDYAEDAIETHTDSIMKHQA